MLICKNCHSENAEGTIKCVQCNMEGKLVHIADNGNKKEYMVVEKSLIQCLNCGTEAPGHEANCVQCNFPMPPRERKPRSSKPSPSNKSFQPWEISNQKTG